MKRLLALLLALCLSVLSVSALADEATATASPSVTGLPDGLSYKSIHDVYTNGGSLVVSKDNGAFAGDDYSVMYISVRNFYNGLSYFGASGVPTVTCDEEKLTATRPNGSSVTFYREDNTFFYSDIDMFNAFSFSINGGDQVGFFPYLYDSDGYIIYDENNEPMTRLIARKDSSASFSRTGDQIGASFDDYGIQVYWTDSDLYVPVAVMSTLFRAGSSLRMCFLDGYLYIMSDTTPDTTATTEKGHTMADFYYDTAVGDRPQALTELNYDLLCLELDLNYGLADEHGIGGDFDVFMTTVGLADQMLKADGQSFHDALTTLTDAYLADFHSSVDRSGPYSGRGYGFSISGVPASTAVLNDAGARFDAARNTSDLMEKTENSDGSVSYTLKAPYQEVGDTAYITFDSFQYMGYSYYSEEFKSNVTDYIADDNIALVYYANSQIKRENSPIRKVVVDLSLNSGGSVNTAVFLTGWLLGECDFSTSNPITGANYTVVYQTDADLDGYITANDTLDGCGLELYLLVSGYSFSCGNLVPALCKESGKVTLLGQTTGGGTCATVSSLTADGTAYSYSGNTRFCTVKNGTYYSIDRGVEPDFVIRKPAHFYDRAWLTDYIATLP